MASAACWRVPVPAGSASAALSAWTISCSAWSIYSSAKSGSLASAAAHCFSARLAPSLHVTQLLSLHQSSSSAPNMKLLWRMFKDLETRA